LGKRRFERNVREGRLLKKNLRKLNKRQPLGPKKRKKVVSGTNQLVAKEGHIIKEEEKEAQKTIEGRGRRLEKGCLSYGVTGGGSMKKRRAM